VTNRCTRCAALIQFARDGKGVRVPFERFTTSTGARFLLAHAPRTRELRAYATVYGLGFPKHACTVRPPMTHEQGRLDL